MTKSPSSARKNSTRATGSPSAIATPRRKSKRMSTHASNDEGVSDVWDFDAPQFYDFANAKTPGPKADKWFENGRLTVDSDSNRSKKKQRTSNTAIQSVDFSDTDDEIEFNKWKSVHALPTAGGSNNSGAEKGRRNTTNSDGNGDDRRDTVVDTSVKTKNSAEASAQSSNKPIQGPKKKAQINSTADSAPNNSRVHGINTSIAGSKGTASNAEANAVVKHIAPVKAIRSKVTKKPASEVVTNPAPSVPKTLTVPVEQCGFMRPTKVAARRVQVKKRDKLDQQAVAQAIAKSINRRLSHNKGTVLTMPKPFHFHESKSNGTNSQTEEPAAEQSAEKRLSKKAQERLIAKLTHKQRSNTSENTTSSTDVTKQKVAAPKKSAAAKILKPTVPKTPQFAKSKRLRNDDTNESTDAANDDNDPFGFERAAREIAQAKARALQVPEKPAPLKTTVPQPFTFRSDLAAERHLLKLREEIAKLQAEEEALRQFRANPLPDFPTPKKRKRQPTQQLHTSPFKLETDVRGETYQRQLRERLAELEQKQRERQQFKARPIPSSLDHPFVPQPSTHPLTASEEVMLKTELRSEERRAFDDDRAERERIREEVLERKRLEEEKRDDEEIKRLRKLLVHKAQPIRHYKPVDVQPSDRPLTVPKTPQWSVRTREPRPNSPSLEATPTK
ncbi:Protein tpx2 [Coemansia sp. RSA 2607]|nr:Protein tpx2 [Coemansia sp. RSA 2607]